MKTASREDDSRREAEEEEKHKLLQERLAHLQRELNQSKAAKRDAASVQEASIAEVAPPAKSQDDGNGENPTLTIKTMDLLPLHGQLRKIETNLSDDLIALIRAVPVYTSSDIEFLLCGKLEGDVEDIIKDSIKSRMENNGGFVRVADFIAIDETLFAHVAWGYMNSK